MFLCVDKPSSSNYSLIVGPSGCFQYFNLTEEAAENIWCVSSPRTLAIFSAFSRQISGLDI